jgi:hypothetical protein
MAEPDEANLPWFPHPLLLDDLEQSTDAAGPGAEQAYASTLGNIALLCSLFCIVRGSAVLYMQSNAYTLFGSQMFGVSCWKNFHSKGSANVATCLVSGV